MFVYTTAIDKIRAMKARKKVIRGGSSAGKTFSILPILIDKAARIPNREISVVSESIPHLKKGAMKDFIKIMKSTGRWIDEHWNATDRKYTFTNGSYIEFFSPESVLGSRRTDLYINEANNILYDDYVQLAMRTSDEIYLDYNPAEEFWADTEVLREEDSELITLTYLDNEARPANVDSDFANFRKKAEAEAKAGLPITSYWQNYCRVYIDGLIGNLQGVVFNNWEAVDAVPNNAHFISYGMDFGFTNDPTAVVKVWRDGNTIWVDECIYANGLTNPDIYRQLILAGYANYHGIVADSAEPKSIRELENMGVKMEAAQKGQDSIRASIDTLQSLTIKVTKDSTNLIRELRSYRWKVDKTGKSMNEPIDFSNHLIDALRYVALNKLSNQDMWEMY